MRRFLASFSAVKRGFVRRRSSSSKAAVRRQAVENVACDDAREEERNLDREQRRDDDVEPRPLLESAAMLATALALALLALPTAQHALDERLVTTSVLRLPELDRVAALVVDVALMLVIALVRALAQAF